MRIAIIGHHVAPICPPFAGGVETMTWYLSRWLARHGHEVVLYAAPGSDVPGVELRTLELHPPISELARADVSMPPDRFMDAHSAYQQVMLELAGGLDGFDLVHSHSLHYLPAAMSELIAAPVVLTVHCPPTPWLEAALRTCRRRYPHLIAVSRATADMWRDSAQITTVIPNGVDLDAWALGAGGPTVAWSGRIVPEKAPHLALAAARRAGRGLRMAGPILDRRYFRDMVAPLLGDAVRYVGHLSHAELADMFAGSAALLQTPVWDEPFGLTAAESMASGTPVVSFARGGVPEVIGERGGVLVAPGDVDELADAIGLAEKLVRRDVRDYALGALGFDRVGFAHERLYESLTAGRPQAPWTLEDEDLFEVPA